MADQGQRDIARNSAPAGADRACRLFQLGVAAVDVETALEAVSLIDVDWDELTAVLSIDDAVAEGAPLVHDDALP